MWLYTLLCSDLFCNLFWLAPLAVSLLGSSQCGWSWARCIAWQGCYILVLELVTQLPSRGGGGGGGPRTSSCMSPSLGTSKVEFGLCPTCGHEVESDVAKALQCVRKLWFRRGIHFTSSSPPPFFVCIWWGAMRWHFCVSVLCWFANITSFFMGHYQNLHQRAVGKRSDPGVGSDGC